MPSRYELRETGTGRRLGTVDLVDVLPPGGVVQLFQSGLVQVEDPAPAEPDAAASSPVATDTRKGKRRATA